MSTHDGQTNGSASAANDRRDEASRVKIFDTTLRDGEQSPGISLEQAGKARDRPPAGAACGVDVIEAGFPITSPGDFECGAGDRARGRRPGDLRVWRATHASRTSMRPGTRSRTPSARASTSFLATSDIHIERKLQTQSLSTGVIRCVVTWSR